MGHRTPDKHLGYYALRRALQADGCAICHIADQAATRYFDTLLYEHVNDPPVREQIRQAGGFCRRHAWQMYQQGGAFEISILWLDVLREQMHALGTHPRRRVRTGFPRCPACRHVAEEEQRMLQALCEYLEADELLEDYAQSAGLCLPHLHECLAAAPRKARAFLLKIETERLATMTMQLDQATQQYDYRNAQRPWGPAYGVWERATIKVAGNAEEASPRRDQPGNGNTLTAEGEIHA